MKIALVSGHTSLSGKDQGAQGYVNEGIVNRQQMLACAEELMSYAGAEVWIEPEGYELNQEIAWVNGIRAAVAAAYHNNAGKGTGWEALVSITGSTTALAKIAEKHMVAAGFKSRGIKTRRNNSGTDYYGFIRQTNCPAIIFETAFVDTWEDARKIDTLQENQAIGKIYATAIAERYGLKRKSGNVVVLPKGKSSKQAKYRTTWSVPIYAGGPVDKIAGWTQRDQVLTGTVTGSYLKLDAGQYVSIKAGNGVMKMHRYKVLNDMYYRIDPNYKTHTPPRIAKAGTIVEGTYYESDKMLRLDRGLYLPEYLKGKKMMQRI